MSGFLRATLLRRVAAATAGAGLACACTKVPTEALAGPPRVNKEIHEISLSVSTAVAERFGHWLPAYLKELLELPGLLGAKILTPLEPAALKPAVVFVLGGPGAGKGTQSEHIVNKYSYVHLSAGDLLRAERKSGSDKAQLINDYIAEGKIVPVEITVGLLMDAIKANGGKRFLVDGFPRNTNNLSGWQQVVGDELQVVGVLFYDCPEDVMEARLLERGKTSGRTDDNIESIRKRFRTYQNETKPILEYYDQQAVLVCA
jgi:UMP-CMP kinase